MNTAGMAEAAKNVGVVVTTASAAAYACGYLVVRARARALGTDPGFTLVDQAYVFAGFRFVLSLLLAVLLVAPLVLAVRALARRTSVWLGPRGLTVVGALAAIVAGVTTILAYAVTIDVSGALLSRQSGWAIESVLERNQFGLLVVLGTTALAACVLPWAVNRLARGSITEPIGLALLAIGLLLATLLPLQHGVFHADRTARLLEESPDGASSLTGPVWLVDRGTGDRVVVYGRSSGGRPALVTLKAEKLDGIAVVGITTLGQVVSEVAR